MENLNTQPNLLSSPKNNDEPISGKAEREPTVPELVLKVVNDYYAKGLKEPNQTQIVKAVVKIKNENTIGVEYKENSIQPSVSRELRKLVSKDKIIKTTDGRYKPHNIETSRALLKEEIISTVVFGPQKIFQMSATTWLLDIERNSMAKAKDLFANYLGPNCYNIFEFNGYLMLLFDGKIEDHKPLREEIKAIRKEAIARQKNKK